MWIFIHQYHFISQEYFGAQTTTVCDRKFLSLLSVSRNLCLHYQMALHVIVVVFQALSHVWLFVTTWTAAP